MTKLLDETKKGTELFIHNLEARELGTEDVSEQLVLAKLRHVMKEVLDNDLLS